MGDYREALTIVLNAVRSAGFPLTGWCLERERVHFLLAGGTTVTIPLERLLVGSPSTVVAELLNVIGWRTRPVTVRPMEEIVELAPQQLARLRFLHWLVSTGRLVGDTERPPAEYVAAS
ncbi:MAG: hypothetical protein RMK01_04495 [Thermomicrobium sp.]|nr:hypothetical protein [Thermomicrobium sp.]